MRTCTQFSRAHAALCGSVLAWLATVVGGPAQSTAVLGWGWNIYGELTIPPGLTNVIAIAGGSDNSLALKADGTVIGWGYYAPAVPRLSNVVAIAAGSAYNLALTRAGQVVGWGDNTYGQSKPPTGLSNIVAIAAGYSHALAVKRDGTVVAWGLNDYGQTNVPLWLHDVVAVAAGAKHSLALKKDGTVAAWGSNYDYMGGYRAQAIVPPGVSNIVAIAAGGYHTLLLRSDGTVLAWGYNYGPAATYAGQAVVPDGLSNVVSITAGDFHSVALRSDGTVAAWGNNYEGELDMPTGLSNVVAVAGGQRFNLALSYSGPPLILRQPVDQTTFVGLPVALAVTAMGPQPLSYQWQFNGTNIDGESTGSITLTNPGPSATGLYAVMVSNAYGTTTSSNTAVTLVAAPPLMVRQPLFEQTTNSAVLISAAAAGSRPLTYQWQFNQLDVEGATNASLNLSNVSVAELLQYRVVVSNAYGVAESSNATVSTPSVVGWGMDNYGQAEIPAGLFNVRAVAAGGNHNLVVNADGTLLAWGNNDQGQITVPSGLTNIVGVAAGYDFSLALQQDGSIIGWGNNNQGQLVPPAGLSNVVALAAGWDHCLALRADGTVVGWGDNADGETTPPAGLSNVVAVAACAYNSLALKSDSTVVRWGAGGSLQLTFPTGLSNVTAIALGWWGYALALKSDGTVLAWGSQPSVLPPGLSNVIGIAAGYSSGFALESDGTVIGWGWNAEGETDVPANTINAQAIFAGGWHSLALINKGKPIITWQPQNQTIFSGMDASFQMRAIGARPVSYQWQFEGAAIDGATNIYLNLAQVQSTNAGRYRVLAANDYGARATSEAQLNVINSPPILSAQPTNQVVLQGSNAMFTVVATGSLPLTYQWRFGGTNIPGATNATLVLNAVQLDQVGTYEVVLSNPFGAITNSTAHLTPVSTWIVGWGRTNDAEIFPPFGLPNVIGIAAGGAHSLALNQDGTVVCWGDNSSGQSTVPPGLTNIIAVAAGWDHSLALRQDGTVVAWGGNVSGEINVPVGLSNVIAVAAGGCDCLPNGNKSLALKRDGTVVGWGATAVPAGLSNVVAIAAGNNHSLALKGDGTVLGWGFNANGQATPPDGLSNVVAIAAGGSHSLALRADGAIVAWGNNTSGQIDVPPGLSNVVAIATGEEFNLALKADGTVVGWGANWSGQSPVPMGLRNVVAIAAGWGHSLALINDGSPAIVREPVRQTIYSGSTLVLSAGAVGAPPLTLQWQLNGTNIPAATNASLILDNVQPADAGTYELQVSNLFGSVTSSNTTLEVIVSPPVLVAEPADTIAVFGNTALLSVTAVGSLPMRYQWLFNGAAVADGTNANLALSKVTFADAGVYSVRVTNPLNTEQSSNASLIVSPVVAWGAGMTNSISGPNYGQSQVPPSLPSANAIAGGVYHSLALSPSGRVTAWGYNGWGQTNTPVSLTNSVSVAAGLYHSLALRNNGTVTAWGYNGYGVTTVPTAATNVAAIAAGWYHNLVLRSNGTVVAWGAGSSGQTTVPTNLTGVAAVAAGGYHSLALRRNGTVVAWGWNAAGQTNVPPGLSNVVAIAAGGSNSIALKSNGTLVAWGDNSYGQSTIPQELSNVVAIAAGAAHNLALRSDGSLVAWGLNSWGQTNVPPLSNVAAVAAGALHSLALVNIGPVTFLNAPYSQTIYEGGEAFFAPVFLGAIPTGYQWLRNGANVPGATNTSLAITNAQFADAGKYQLVVSNRYGAVTSAVGVLTVDSTKPLFTVQPANAWVIQNSNITLRAELAGIPPFSLQWELNGMPVVGATNMSLTLTNAQFANQGSYQLWASNAYGTATSAEAFLAVIDLPNALGLTNVSWMNPNQPPWFAESAVTHDGVAAAAVGPLAYGQQSLLQTAVNGPGTLNFWWETPSSYASLTFSVDGRNMASSGNSSNPYWRQFAFYLSAGWHALTWACANNWSPFGSGMAYLDQVSFTPGGTAPTITAQPVSQTNAAGNSVTFSVGAVGTPPMAFRWFFNGEGIPNATAPSLTIANVQTNNIGGYNVTASNNYGTAASLIATLTVIPSGPTFTSQPANAVVLVGGSATLSALAIGSSPVMYQWLFNDAAIPGATNPALTISNVQYANGGTYAVLATNIMGAAVSSNAVLRAYSFGDLAASLADSGLAWSTTDVPWFPQTNTTHDGFAAAQSGAISDSQVSTLQAVTTGPATVTYWWKVSCDSFWDSLSFSLNGTIQNSIAGSVDWQQGTNYIGEGSQILQWRLYPVHGAFAGGTGWLDQVQVVPGVTGALITANPANISTNAGNNVLFSVSAIGTPPLLYQWQLGGTNIPGATNATLILTDVQNHDAGNYTVGVTNQFGGAASSNATLVVVPSLPVITTQPASQSRVVNGNATFTVAAKGSKPFQYQWQFNHTPISGANFDTLSLNHLKPADAGLYSVIVRNDYGAATSSIAALEVARSTVLEFWPLFSSGQKTPFGLSNVTALACGSAHTIALRDNGTVTAWGGNNYGQTNVPTGLSNVTAVAAGFNHSVALKSDGTVLVWGDITYGQQLIPDGLSNITAVAAAANDTFALKGDGTVVGWGDNASGQLNIPAGLSNVVAVAAGVYNGFAVKSDGTVAQWGNGPAWIQNGTNTQLTIGMGLNGVAAVGAGGFSGWSLQNDGTVRAYGWGSFPGLEDFSVSAISAAGTTSPSYDYLLALKSDGSLVINHFIFSGPYLPFTPSNVVALAAGHNHAAVVVNDGTPRVVRPLLHETADIGSTVIFSSGVSGAGPLNYQWQLEGTNIPGATGGFLVLSNVPLSASGNYACIVTNTFGAATNLNGILSVLHPLPTMDPIPNQTVQANRQLLITNMAWGVLPPGRDLQFTLLAGPADAQIWNLSSTNAVFAWTPSCDQGGTTNLITIQVSDAATPPLTATRSFSVIVQDCVQVKLGTTVVRANEDGCLPVELFCTTQLTNAAFAVLYPSNRLDNLALLVNTQLVESALLNVASDGFLQAILNLGTNLVPRQATNIVTLCFRTLANQSSAFVPIDLPVVAATRLDGTVVTNASGLAGRIVVVGDQPLLEALAGPGNQLTVLQYALPGSTLSLQWTTNLPPSTRWQLAPQTLQTNLVQPGAILTTDRPALFFRSLQQ